MFSKINMEMLLEATNECLFEVEILNILYISVIIAVGCSDIYWQGRDQLQSTMKITKQIKILNPKYY